MLNWTGKKAHAWKIMFNHALQNGMPYDLNTNWIKPLHKGESVNYVNNY